MTNQNKHTKLGHVYKTIRKTPDCIIIILSSLWTFSLCSDNDNPNSRRRSHDGREAHFPHWLAGVELSSTVSRGGRYGLLTLASCGWENAVFHAIDSYMDRAVLH